MVSISETMNTGSAGVAKEKLIDDLKTLAHDTAGFLKNEARAARGRLSAAMQHAKPACQRFQEGALTRARATDQCIRNHPYETIGVIAAAALVIGFFWGRRRTATREISG